MAAFRDRIDAGRHLATLLLPFARGHPVVIGVAGGGVAVAAQVALALDAPLDVVCVCPIRAGDGDEVVGALAEGGALCLDGDALEASGAPGAIARAAAELERVVRLVRPACPRASLAGRTAIVVDDGVLTGLTLRAAVRAVRRGEPALLVAAAPILPETAAAELAPEVDALVRIAGPGMARACRAWYDDFAPVPDGEVVAWLATARARAQATA